MHHGRLVAQAPIAELLAGSSGDAYTLTMRGDAQAVQARLIAQPWVASVATGPSNGTTTLHINVRDVQVAEAQLLRLALADTTATVSAFGRTQHSLEDIFVNLIEGGNTNGNA